MYRFFSLSLLVLGTPFFSWGQKAPELDYKVNEVKEQLYFLASDFMKGRNTPSVEQDIAAHYLASHLAAYGYQPAPGMDGFFQKVPFDKVTSPQFGEMVVNGEAYPYKESFLWLAGEDKSMEQVEAVFVDYGWVDDTSDDYANKDVKGKVVFALPGTPEDQSPQSVFQATLEKIAAAQERGAVAFVQLYRLQFPWNFFTRYFGGSSLQLGSEEESGALIPNGFLNESSNRSDIKDLIEGKKTMIDFSIEGYSKKRVYANNVVGYLEGSDPEKKEEVLLLSAHYDHVGVGSEGGGAYTDQDSIFNGARDNGMGSVAVLTAVRALAEQKPERSILVLWCTGEEKGLLGSRYFSNHLPVEANKIIFNLNTDGAGYNDTDYVAVIGYGRTGTDEIITQAAEAAGLQVFPNPAPDQGLFDRSDNVNFALMGIPALTYSPGLTSFDSIIQKYYHQVADNPDNVDYDYMLKYCISYAHLARMIANCDQKPVWVEGDKYEEAGKELYGGGE